MNGTSYSAKPISTAFFVDWVERTVMSDILPFFRQKNDEYGATDEYIDDVLATINQAGMRNFPGLYSKYPYLAMIKAIGVLEDKHLISMAMSVTPNDYAGKAKDCVIYSLFRMLLYELHDIEIQALEEENSLQAEEDTTSIVSDLGTEEELDDDIHDMLLEPAPYPTLEAIKAEVKNFRETRSSVKDIIDNMLKRVECVASFKKAKGEIIDTRGCKR